METRNFTTGPVEAVPWNAILQNGMNFVEGGIRWVDLRMVVNYCNPSFHHYIIRTRAILGLVLGIECSIFNLLLVVSLMRQEEFRSLLFFPVVLQVRCLYALKRYQK